MEQGCIVWCNGVKFFHRGCEIISHVVRNYFTDGVQLFHTIYTFITTTKITTKATTIFFKNCAIRYCIFCISLNTKNKLNVVCRHIEYSIYVIL